MGTKILECLDWKTLEKKVCAVKEIDAKLFFSHTNYNCDEDSNIKEWFEQIFTEFDQEMRRKYLQFVWGRERLPDSDFTHEINCDDEFEGEEADKRFPVGETCSFAISMPVYTSADIMKERLVYAINNCIYIDADFEVGEEEE